MNAQSKTGDTQHYFISSSCGQLAFSAASVSTRTACYVGVASSLIKLILHSTLRAGTKSNPTRQKRTRCADGVASPGAGKVTLTGRGRSYLTVS